MPCIGNDIVDLKHPANARKSKDFRYLKKILADVEIEFVRDAGNPDRALWSLWACKETAYKAISKSYTGLSFLPRLWRVELNQHEGVSVDGRVIIPGACAAFVRLFLSEVHVHCIGSENLSDINKIIWGIESLPVAASKKCIEPSSFVRECLTKKLACIYQLNLQAMEVKRENIGGKLQPPRVFYENKIIPFDISLSHDGQFIAYAFLKII